MSGSAKTSSSVSESQSGGGGGGGGSGSGSGSESQSWSVDSTCDCDPSAHLLYATMSGSIIGGQSGAPQTQAFSLAYDVPTGQYFGYPPYGFSWPESGEYTANGGVEFVFGPCTDGNWPIYVNGASFEGANGANTDVEHVNMPAQYITGRAECVDGRLKVSCSYTYTGSYGSLTISCSDQP